jgi:hypothetical protein
MESVPQTEDEWNSEDDNAGNKEKWHENGTATRKLTGEKRKHKNGGEITGKLGKTGVNINTQADGKTAQEMMKERRENACEMETGYRTPVKMVWIIDATCKNFFLRKAFSTILEKFASVDPSVYIYSSTSNTTWKLKEELPVGDEFNKDFDVQHKQIGKGATKVLLFVNVISNIRINTIKFND